MTVAVRKMSERFPSAVFSFTEILPTGCLNGQGGAQLHQQLVNTVQHCQVEAAVACFRDLEQNYLVANVTQHPTN